VEAAAAFQQFRQAEIRHFRRAILRKKDIRGFQVAVDDAFLVRVMHGASDLLHEVGRVDPDCQMGVSTDGEGEWPGVGGGKGFARSQPGLVTVLGSMSNGGDSTAAW
jgi:hypothetical protein